MAIILNETFTGTDGTLPANWADAQGTGTNEILGDEFLMIGPNPGGGYYGNWIYYTGDSDISDFEATFTFESGGPEGSTADAQFSFGFRIDDPTDISDDIIFQDGYIFNMRVGRDETRFRTVVATSTSTSGAVTGVARDNEKWQVKVRAEGTALKWKMWEDGTSEPGAWGAEVTNATYSTGSIALCTIVSGNQDSNFYIDNLVIDDLATPSGFDGSYVRTAAGTAVRIREAGGDYAALYDASGDRWEV